SPGRCRLPAPTWGWAAQLYAARSGASWGIGDLADLARFVEWARRRGSGVTMINPLHAPLPTPYHEASPYFPSSRIYRNILSLRIEEVDGAADLPDLERLAALGRRLNEEPLLDQTEAYRLKMTALQLLFER